MAVKASATITLFDIVDIGSTTLYYLLQSSTASPPSKPTTATPSSSWKTVEPAYTEGSTNTLYTVMKTTFSDGTFEYSPVSKSSSYEAAKAAYNKAIAASKTATNYMNYTDGVGLVIGDMTADTLGNNVRIDLDSVDIRNGNNVFSSFHSKGMVVYGENEEALTLYRSEYTDENNTKRYKSCIQSDNYDLSIETTDSIELFGLNGASVKSVIGPVIIDGSESEITLLSPKIFVKKSKVSEGTYYPVLSTIDGLNSSAYCSDFVVSQGTSGIWKYRKWASGIVECWGVKQYTGSNITGAYGNLFYVSGSVSTPFEFKSYKNIQATPYVTSNGLYGISIKSGTTGSSIVFFIYSAKSETQVDINVELYVVGEI